MKIATTTGDFARYCPTDAERIRELHRAGFRYIDLSLYSLPESHPYMQEGWRDEIKKIKNLADELGMKFVQAHAPGANFLSPTLADPDFVERSILRSIEICAELGIQNNVIHFGFGKELSKQESFQKNLDYLQKFFPALERYGVNLLVENSCQKNMGEIYYPNSGADIAEFLALASHKHLHACWDTGHANCEGPQYEQITALGKELYALHYNDNHGKSDEHVIPFLGTLNHDEVLHALIDIGYSGYFTLECEAALVSDGGWPHKRRVFEADKRLANAPLPVKQQSEILLYTAAKHILCAYDLFEE